MTQSDPPASPDEIIAKPGAYYRRARYIICLIVLAAGLWFGYDGWIGYPRIVKNFNMLPAEKQAEAIKPPNDLAIALQKWLFSVLVPLSPILLAYFLHRSRGCYRLAGATLHVPGHPPVAMDAIVGIDKSLWMRKGIAYVDYEVAGLRKPARLTLDDFIYEQAPTDAIVERIERMLTLHATRAPSAAATNAAGPARA